MLCAKRQKNAQITNLTKLFTSRQITQNRYTTIDDS